MSYEKEFRATVNRSGDIEEVILREVDGVDTFTTRPESEKQGYFKSGAHYRGVFTEVVGSAPPPEPAPEPTPEAARKGKK